MIGAEAVEDARIDHDAVGQVHDGGIVGDSGCGGRGLPLDCDWRRPIDNDRANRARADWDKQRKTAEAVLKKWVDGQRTKVCPQLRAAKIAKFPIPDAEKVLLERRR